MEYEDERRLVQKLAAGDSDCLEQVLETLRPKLLRLIAGRIPRKLNRRVDADDIVQIALISFTIRVREWAYHFDDLEDVEHLLVTISFAKLRKAMRSEFAARRDASREDSDNPGAPSAPSRREAVDLEGDPLEKLVASDLLRRILQALPPHDQDMVRFWIEQYTIEEISHMVACSPRHVDQVLAKARRLLRDLQADQ